MKRKTSSVPSKVYTYGCHAPIVNAEIVADQYGKGRAYRNKLVEIELARRKSFRDVRLAMPEVNALEDVVIDIAAKLDGARDLLMKIKSKERTKNPSTKEALEIKGLIHVLKLQLKDARGKLKVSKESANESDVMKVAFEAADEAANEAVKKARAENGLYWGTYLLIERSAEQFRKEREDPQFRRWDGAGRIGVQIQKGATAEQLFSGKNTLLQIEQVSELAFHGRRSERRMNARTKVSIRVSSNDKGAPVWAVFPVTIHRQIPKDAIVKWAWIKRTPVGRKMRYELQITVEAESLVTRALASRKLPTVAIDVGWRCVSDSLRVGYMWDSDYRSEELLLPEDAKNYLDHPDSLRAIRDGRFNDFRQVFRTHLSEIEVPTWLKEATVNLSHWRSHVKLVQIFKQWKQQRFDGDASAYEDLLAWYKKEIHLYDWESNERDQGLAWRKNFYRNLALSIARRYDRVVLEKFNLSDVALLPMPEEAVVGPEKAKKWRFRVGLSEFRQVLTSTCAREGVEIVLVPAEMTTIVCHECGHDEPWNKIPKIMHTCDGCKLTWDQDLNAAKNIMGRWKMSVASGHVVQEAPDPLEDR